MADKVGDEETREPYDEQTLRRFARDLDTHTRERKRIWGDTDENLLAAYLDGKCTPEEKAKVEKAIDEYPAVRDFVELSREQESPGWLASTVATLRAALTANRPKGQDAMPWTEREEDSPKRGPGNLR